jgi:hypothetical protein
MSEHLNEAALHAWAEDELPADQRAAPAAHLAACAACRADADALRGLLGQLAGLPRSIMPPRDLRPDIWQRIDATENTAATAAMRPRLGQRTLASTRWLLVAAAVVLIAVSSALTLFIAKPRPRATMAATSLELPAGEIGAMEARYLSATAELERFLDEQRELLPQETVQLLEANLRVIDRALAEARQALADNPGNAGLSRILMANWEKKLGLLRSATQKQVGIT